MYACDSMGISSRSSRWNDRPLDTDEFGRSLGDWTYLPARDVQIFGRCEATIGIAPLHRLLTQVMSQPPYRDARRVFCIIDNGR